MAVVVHIPESEIVNVKPLLDRARDGERVVIEDNGVAFELSRRPVGRTAEEILADPSLRWSEAFFDEEWEADMASVIRDNRAHDRDPWA